MLDLIAIPLGWVMYLIYQLVHSYGVSILLFTIFVKLLTLPNTYKMQVNQARQGLLGPKLLKIRKSFASNMQRQQEETQKLYKEEGINQTAGCLGGILTMFLLFGVYRVVLQPLTFILRYSSVDLENAKTLLTTWATDNGIIDSIQSQLSTRPELMLLSYAKSNPEIFSSMGSFAEKLGSFENVFLGIDLTAIPTLTPESWTFTALLLVLLPVISGLTQFAMTIIQQRHSKKMNPTMPNFGALNVMLYMSPILTIFFGLKVPAGLSFYWFINALLQILMMLALYKYLSGERLMQINEKEKQKVLAKGPTWMQRKMEESMAFQAEMNGAGGSRTEANRTRYADGDDGMSRKERAEYERKLIEARRKAVALKYGDEIPEDDDDLDFDD